MHVTCQMADNIKPLESIWVVLPKPLSDEAKRDVLAGFRTLEELCDENNWYNEWLSRFSPHWAGVSCPMCGIHCHRSLHCPSPLKWREAERVKASGENLKALRDEFRAKRANKDKYADASSGTNV
uniref:Uncharacterized protein n=1 Tax=Arundo donax TaxID=35708 RepID=A0A0A8ZSF0_ARUDO